MHALLQVAVSFSQAMQQQPANIQADLLRQLAVTLDRCKDMDVKGLHFMIGSEGNGIDHAGNLWLDSAASAELWLQ